MRTTALLPILALLSFPAAALAEPATVVRMSDGDSGRMTFRGAVVTVRILGMDSAETGTHAKCDAERAKGDEAKAYALTLLPPGKVVDLRPKVGGKPDRYGRMLAEVYVDGVNYAEHMIARGYAVPYEGHGPKFAEQMGICR